MKRNLRCVPALFLTATIILATACGGGGSDGGGNAGDSVINIASIAGVTPPSLGAIPVTAITETAQYTGTVRWNGGWAWSPRFGGNKAYTATITLTAKSGYTLTGVTADFFTVPGATGVTHSADSGVITAVFPATVSVAVGNSALGGKVAYILTAGDPGYVAGEQRGLIIATEDQAILGIWALIDYQTTAVPGGTGTALGTGSANTDNIIALNGPGATYAAGMTRAYTGGGYSDWYLPSKDEIYKLYLNRVAIGGFDIYSYWSSSEFNYEDAWIQDFYYGNQYHGDKGPQRVRAVRSF